MLESKTLIIGKISLGTLKDPEPVLVFNYYLIKV